jgi:hypothetical protein
MMNQPCEECEEHLDEAAALIHETIVILTRSKMSQDLQVHYNSEETLLTVPEYEVKRLLMKLGSWSRRY